METRKVKILHPFILRFPLVTSGLRMLFAFLFRWNDDRALSLAPRVRILPRRQPTPAVDIHLQRGHVTSTDRVFLLALEVDPDADVENLNHHVPGSNCWHVWIAAGSVAEWLAIALHHGADRASWHRFHGGPTRHLVRALGAPKKT